MAGDKLIYSKGGAAKIRETAVLGEGESLRNWEPFLEAVAGAEETRILQVGEIRLLIEVFMTIRQEELSREIGQTAVLYQKAAQPIPLRMSPV